MWQNNNFPGALLESIASAVNYLLFSGILCLISDSDKMIKLFTLDFYEEIVDTGDARILSFKSNC